MNEGKKYKTWVSATSLRNYFIRDPFLDWVEYHHFEYILKNKKYAAKINHPRGYGRRRWFETDERLRVPLKTPTFTRFITNQGNKFEERVINDLYHRYKTKIVDGVHSYEATSYIRLSLSFDRIYFRCVLLSPFIFSYHQ